MMHQNNHNHNDAASLSRATSMSRTSKQGSAVSRNQSLIKKNVAPQDLRPSDILIERFVAWKVIVKQLIAYFEVRQGGRGGGGVSNCGFLIFIHLWQGIADIENNTAKELTKLGSVIQVPFRSGNQFLGEGGLQVRVVVPWFVRGAPVSHQLCGFPLGHLLRHTGQNSGHR